MNLANAEIRAAAKEAKIPLWRVANELGISEPSMTRKLRMELDTSERMRILAVIGKLDQVRKEGDT